MSKGPGRVRGETLAAWILRLYPRRFRERHGKAVLDTFRRAVREGGSAPGQLLDLVVSLPGAHLAAFQRSSSCSGTRIAGGLGRDLRMVLRRMGRQPGIPLVVVATVALAVGSTTAVFSAVHAVVLRPLPYESPQRLVRIFGTTAQDDSQPISLADALEWREAATLDDVAMYDLSGTQLSTPDGREALGSADVSANLFRMLGVDAALGRVFAPGEDLGSARTVVLAHDFWRTRFAGDPGVVGREIVLEGEDHTVIGVLPPEWEDPIPHPDYRVRLYSLFDLTPSELVRSQHSFQALARLAPGATLEQASTEVEAISTRIRERFPEEKAGRGVRLVALERALVGQTRSALWLLLGAVGLVMVVACANVGSILLARNATRRRALGVRRALGAGRVRIARELLIESLVLGMVGGAMGVALAWVGHQELSASVAERIPRIADTRLSLPVLAFGVLSSLGAAVLFGVAPAFQASRTDPGRALRESAGPGISTGPGLRRALDGLALAEMALAVVLLVGAGLLGRSFLALAGVDAGFQPENVLTFRLSHQLGDDPDRLYELQESLADRLEGLSPVRAAGAVNFVPLGGNWACIPFTAENRPRAFGDDPCAEFRTATPGYFPALGIRILEGRLLTRADDDEAPPVVLVNRTMARDQWGDAESAVGRRIKWGRPDGGGTWRTVVGVVEDVHHFGLAQDPGPEVYMTFRQGRDISTVFTARLSQGSDPRRLVPSLRSLVKEVDSELEVSRVATMEELVRGDLAEPRFRTVLLGVFASLALAIALVGVYGLLSFTTARRAPEIAMRMVLGARPTRVVGMVVGRAVSLAAAALVLGGAVAWWLSSLLEAFLFGVPRTDPVTFAAVAVLLLATAAGAGWFPARRVARVQPLEALRA